MTADKVLALKDQGNKALNSGKYDEAVKHYSEAIEIDPTNHVLYSNRSAAYAKMDKYTDSLKDAEKTVSINSEWPKGYSRKGAALAYLGRHNDAIAAYEKGLMLDPTNQQIKEGLEDCKAKTASQRMNPFSDPNLMAQLTMNPRTRDFMRDPEYIKIIKDLQSNPQSLSKHLSDKRVLTTLGALVGMDVADMDAESDPPTPPPAKPKTPEEPKPEPMDVDLTEGQREALKEKDAGNVAYKGKKFEKALEHYNKATELDPVNIMYYNNKAAVYYEKKEFEECIKLCQTAVEVGRENRADFKLISKALTRIANAYKNMKDFQNAKVYYQKSLAEHRTPETKEALSKVEKLIKESERRAYIDPAKAEDSRVEGNEAFKSGDYPMAIKHYSEAIRRNPENAKTYSNRAACYTKLAEFTLGLKDCEECIRVDPSFVKGYVRKGKILQALKQQSKAESAYQKALSIDSNCSEAAEGLRECMMASSSDPEEVRKRAMNDPEVQQILKDPAMRIILEQMQTDPRALQDHLKNPDVATKIRKLLSSGLISIQ